MRQVAAELGVRAVDRRQQLITVVFHVAGRHAACDIHGGADGVVLLNGCLISAFHNIAWRRWWDRSQRLQRIERVPVPCAASATRIAREHCTGLRGALCVDEDAELQHL